MRRISSSNASRVQRARQLAYCLATTLILAAAAVGVGAAPAIDDESPLPEDEFTQFSVESVPVGEIVEEVATANNPDQQYALYLPTGYGATERTWPVLLVLDPRGRAVPGVERFLPAAETHGYVVLSSSIADRQR